jgi:regulator of protease activity HflC (stomatin/prohibitin superfamily)
MAESVAANLLLISVPIEYRIKDINAYLYEYAEPQRVMESIVFQMVSEYAASVDVDQLIGPGRMEFNADLRERLQRRLDEFKLGIELVFVGIRGAHPTAEEQVASTYQKVVSAQTSMGTMIGRARGKAQSMLTKVAGSVERATALDEAILAKDRLEQDPEADPEELKKAQGLVDTLLLGDPLRGIAPVGGEAAVQIAEAREKSSAAVTEAANKARQFQAEVASYRASPQLYMARKRLERFEDLPFVRKYLIVGDAGNVIFEYTDSREAGLDAVLQEGYEKEKKKASE